MSVFRTCPDCGRLMLSDAKGNIADCYCRLTVRRPDREEN